MLEKLDPIVLYRGATTILEIDLTEWDMRLGIFLLTVRDLEEDIIFKEFELTTSEKHQIIFKDDETINLVVGKKYGYDIMMLIDEERYPQCSISPVKVVKVVGRHE